jgi:Flp pilus assembly protein TadG
MLVGKSKTLLHNQRGQSMIEFALILPLMVLIIVGIFDLGRAFFAYISITNAAREGARVATFWPGKTTGNDVVTAIQNELMDSPMIDLTGATYQIECMNGASFVVKPQNSSILVCDSGKPVRVTVTYPFNLIIGLIFPKAIILERSAQMMIP